MIFYPKGYFNNITEIKLEYLKENNIKGLILDVDNTLIDYDKNLSKDVIKWIETMKSNDIKMFILSNSNKKDKVEEVGKKLDINYIYFGLKPLKKGFKKAQKQLGLDNSNIAVIGDQIYTDIVGANRMKMYSILLEPIGEKDIFITVLKRPIENLVKKFYFRKLRRSK